MRRMVDPMSTNRGEKMTQQDMLEVQRYLRQTRPELRAGSHNWWDAMRAAMGTNRAHNKKGNAMSARTLTIRHRVSGEVATVMDITGMTESELDKVWTGLARKVDFVKWQVVDSDTEVANTDPAILRSIATIRETDYRGANT